MKTIYERLEGNSFNSLKLNGISRGYQLEQSISDLRDAWRYFFIFTQIFIEILQANSGDPSWTLHSAASDLVLHCLPTSSKKGASFIWVKITKSNSNTFFLSTDVIPVAEGKKVTYPCQFCHKVLLARAWLQRHERIHTGEKPYSCAFCGRCFNTKSGRKSHTLVHGDILNI